MSDQPPSAPRTLKDYRPQHDDDCQSQFCYCGNRHRYSRMRTQQHGEHAFLGKLCTCGLDALLASASAPQGQEKKKIDIRKADPDDGRDSRAFGKHEYGWSEPHPAEQSAQTPPATVEPVKDSDA